MYTNTRQWNRIRKRILKSGDPQRQVARAEGVSRRTIKKMLEYEFPPGYKGCNLKKLSATRDEEPIGTARACYSKSPRAKQRWMEWMYSLASVYEIARSSRAVT